MAAILVVIGVVLVLAAMWLGAILVERHLRLHWEARLEAHFAELHEGVDPFGPEDQQLPVLEADPELLY